MTEIANEYGVPTRQIEEVLAERGHNVTRTPCERMVLDASDEQQLLGATACGWTRRR